MVVDASVVGLGFDFAVVDEASPLELSPPLQAETSAKQTAIMTTTTGLCGRIVDPFVEMDFPE
ncbi:unannotated protein [freshwater metagenome]|uniref:Unannotated protein n=1 Tax=freshwater metagenome TaxID=449393 RepID=A0A6J6D2M3_9ZZZZ